MNIEPLKRRLNRSLKKEGLTLVTTRRDSRDFWQMGRYALIDGRRMLVQSDVDLWELARLRELVKPGGQLSIPAM